MPNRLFSCFVFAPVCPTGCSLALCLHLYAQQAVLLLCVCTCMPNRLFSCFVFAPVCPTGFSLALCLHLYAQQAFLLLCVCTCMPNRLTLSVLPIAHLYQQLKPYQCAATTNYSIAESGGHWQWHSTCHTHAFCCVIPHEFLFNWAIMATSKKMLPVDNKNLCFKISFNVHKIHTKCDKTDKILS